MTNKFLQELGCFPTTSIHTTSPYYRSFGDVCAQPMSTP
jgi:hypothetical protein